MQDIGSELLSAARDGKADAVSDLLTHNELDVNSADSFKRTALINAAKDGHEEVIKRLLAHDGI